MYLKETKVKREVLVETLCNKLIGQRTVSVPGGFPCPFCPMGWAHFTPSMAALGHLSWLWVSLAVPALGVMQRAALILHAARKQGSV